MTGCHIEVYFVREELIGRGWIYSMSDELGAIVRLSEIYSLSEAVLLLCET